MGEVVLSARGLVFEADGVRLLDVAVLDIEAGGPTVILGANGAGKSLLLRLLHGLILPSAGTVVVSGGRQAMVFQKPVLLRRSVAANVDYVLAVNGMARGERKAVVAVLLAEAGLAEKADQAARSLSGGEQQRLALVRAMAVQPVVLFLDEPTSSLDPEATEIIEAMISAAAAAGTKVVMITHDLGQARRLAGDVVFCYRGTVAEHSEAAAFFDGPESAAAVGFLAGKLVF
ncbi:MAG: ATP-binding cassette domain-containing protein [Paracoccaceae bacterium]